VGVEDISEDPYIYVDCCAKESRACAEAEWEKVEEEMVQLRAELGEDGPTSTAPPCLRATHQCLLRRTQATKIRIQELRRAAGERLCRSTGEGAKGQFCLELDAGGTALSSNHVTDGRLAERLTRLFQAQFIVDLGCGLGGYGRHFLAANESIRWLGYDGSANVESATGGHVKNLDLSRRVWLGRRFDWVSFQVHVPRL
jgi:hypothetical protein